MRFPCYVFLDGFSLRSLDEFLLRFVDLFSLRFVNAFSLRFIDTFSLRFLDAFLCKPFSFLSVFSPIVYSDTIKTVFRFHLKHKIENSVHI